GNLLSLPFGGGLLYVQPAYLQSRNVENPYPLMRLVLVNYGNYVGFGDSLQAAIQNLMSKAGGSPVTPTEPTEPTEPGTEPPSGELPALTPELAAAVARLDAAIAAVERTQASGDFAAYGAA